jgi:transposase
MEKEILKSKNGFPPARFSLAFKKKVVAEFERGFLNKDQLQVKYGIR